MTEKPFSGNNAENLSLLILDTYSGIKNKNSIYKLFGENTF